MKIAYFAHYFPPAGYAAATNTYEIVKRLTARGHRLLVFTQPTFSKGTIPSSSQYKGSWPANLEVYQSLPTPLPLSVIVPHGINILKAMRYEYDSVITQFHIFHLASLPGYIIKALRAKPWIVKAHDLNPDPSLLKSVPEKMFCQIYYEAFLNILGRKADRILVLTSRLRRVLEEDGRGLSKVVVIPNGVDTRLFSPAASEQSSTSSKTILYIGAMRPQYGLDRLVKAFALLEPTPNLRLMLVGDGPERPRLAELAKKLRVEENVDFRGYVPHESLPSVIRNAYVTVGPLLPSPANYYTIPTKVLEYFACGKTVVSSELSRDILNDGRTGLVVSAATPETIAEKLSNLLCDEKLTKTLGRNARRLVEEEFDWNRIIDKLEKELHDVLLHGYC